MSLQTEVPGVNNAVEKLQELADRMRGVDFGFRDNDVDNIDRVIESLQELDIERKKVHEQLETETIKASVLRHTLLFLPGQIKDEIMVAVNSARQSNAQAQQELQDKLDAINKNIIYLGDRHQQLEKENSVLHPERELIRQQHEEIISQLNQRMAEKASMQIALNETRDKVRQSNQNIVDLEDGILQLKEDLIQERTGARHEKKRLKKAVADTTEKTKEQREQNMGKKKELDSFQEKLVDSEGRLDAVRKSIRRYETSRSQLEGAERVLTTQLSRERKMNEHLRRKGASIINDHQRELAEFEELEKKLNARIKKFENDIENEREKNEDLETRKTKLQGELKQKMVERQEDTERVQRADNHLQSTKMGLALKAEEVGRMQTENIEMTEEIENLAESHKAVLAQLNKQIEEYREQLAKERKDRMELQSQKEGIQKILEDVKTDQQRYMKTVNQKIQEGKTKHVELSNEGTQLQKVLRKDEDVIQNLQGDLDTVQKKYEEMFSSMQTKVQTMEQEILDMESALEEKKTLIEERTPVFEELEETFQERTEAYEKMKKDVVAMKNNKTSLEDKIMKAKMDKEKMGPPQEELHDELKERRDESLNQLKQQGANMQDTERQIYIAGSKLRTVMEENQRFEEACKRLEKDILDLQQQIEQNEEVKVRLEENLIQSKEELIGSWEADRAMQEWFACRDQNTCDAFGRLVEKTGKRESKISEVTGRLNEELQVLSKFLDNVSSRRPKEFRESRRPGTRDSRRTQSAVEAVAAANLALNESPRPPSQMKSQRSEKSIHLRPGTRSSVHATKEVS